MQEKTEEEKQKEIWHYLNILRESFKMVQTIKRCVSFSVS